MSAIHSLRNPANCTNVKIMRQSHLLSTAAFRMCLLNVRSVRNKGLTVKDFTVDHDLDALRITETWLRPGNEDMVEMAPCALLVIASYTFHDTIIPLLVEE